MRIREEKINCNEIVKQLVDERDNVPTSIDFLLKVKDPAREILKYSVYKLKANNYSECVEKIANNQFALNALLNYFGTLYREEGIYKNITVDDYRNPHGFIKNVREVYDSNYIWPNVIPNSPIKDIFLDVLKLSGWWTNDNNFSLYSDEFSKKFVSRLVLDFDD